MKQPRVRKWAKWACTLAAVLAASAAVFSRFYECVYNTTSNSGDTIWTMFFMSGQMVIIRDNAMGREPLKPPVKWNVMRSADWFWGYSGEENPYDNDLTWRAGVCCAKYRFGWKAGASVLYPVALTLFPAALLWYADRRRFGPGSCIKCGYDRRGISADAKCPECGNVPATASK